MTKYLSVLRNAFLTNLIEYLRHYLFSFEFNMYSRTGKIKGIERILGTVETLQENLIEVTSGQAKYEHQHRAIVWRCPRLPKEGQGMYAPLMIPFKFNNINF